MKYTIIDKVPEFEQNFLKKININPEALLKATSFNSLNEDQLQMYIETRQLVFVYTTYNESIKIFAKKTAPILKKKMHEMHEIISLYCLDNKFEKTAEMLITWIYINLNEKLVKEANIDEDDCMWYNVHDIVTQTVVILNKFNIFFKKEFTLLNEIKKKKQYSLIFSILILGFKWGFLRKKILIKDNKKIKFLSLAEKISPHRFTYKYNIFIKKPELLVFEKQSYFYGLHYLSVSEVYRDNLYSNKYFFLKNTSFLEKIREIKYFLKKDLYDSTVEILIKKNNLSGADFFEEAVEKYIQYNKAFYIKDMQKRASFYYHAILLFSLKDIDFIFDRPIYFSYYFDFRGRLYCNSPISLQSNAMFRFLYTYGTYLPDDLKKFKMPQFLEALNIKSILQNSCNFIIKNYNIDINEPLQQYMLFMVLFEVGKIFKNKFLEEYNGKLKTEDFIKIGIDIFKKILLNESEEEINLESLIELKYWTICLYYWSSKKYEKFIVYKDSTASAIQLLVVVLGGSSEEIYEACNLTETGVWNDTYFYIIQLFLKNYKFINEANKQYFNRTYLKKTIMIYNYSATLLRCWDEFIINIKNPENSLEDLFQDFKNFYEFLKKVFESGYFFKKPSKLINDQFKNYLKTYKNIKINLSDDSTTFLEYYKVKSYRIDKTLLNSRETFSLQKLTNELDESKIFRALKPNLIHSLDANFVREVILRMTNPIITIHDSYGVDLLNVFILIKNANIAINNIGYYNEFIILNNINEQKTFSSFFILL